MDEKELRKLRRVELIEMLLVQEEALEEARAELKEANKKLEDRSIAISKAGNIAEASLLLNGVFEAAQSAAKQYLDNIENLSSKQEAICASMAQETRRKCETLKKETKEKCVALEIETQEKCDKMKADAEQAVNAYWKNLSEKVDNLCKTHDALSGLIGSIGKNQNLKLEE